jgi:LysM repeat protein
VIKSQKEFYQKMPSDFLFPLKLDRESLKKIVEGKENKKISGWQYVVKKGETLWQISKKFKVPLSDLLYYNGLSENSTIKAGDKIVIPGVKPQAIIGGPVKKFAGKFVSALQEIGNFIVPASGFNWGILLLLVVLKFMLLSLVLSLNQVMVGIVVMEIILLLGMKMEAIVFMAI